MCTGKRKDTHTHRQAGIYAYDTHTHAQVCISFHRHAAHTRKLRGEDEKNTHLKALIRIWTVTRVVHKLGEI